MWPFGGRISNKTVIRRLHGSRYTRADLWNDQKWQGGTTMHVFSGQDILSLELEAHSLVRWKPVYVEAYWRSDKCFAGKEYSFERKSWRLNNCFRWWWRYLMELLFKVLYASFTDHWRTLKYCDSISGNHVRTHFDNHALGDRPMFEDDNARSHCARVLKEFLEAEGIETLA